MTNKSEDPKLYEHIRAALDQLCQDSSAGLVKFLAVTTIRADGSNDMWFAGTADGATMVGLIEIFKIELLLKTIDDDCEDDDDSTHKFRINTRTYPPQ